jgi:hypothetical protein
MAILPLKRRTLAFDANGLPAPARRRPHLCPHVTHSSPLNSSLRQILLATEPILAITAHQCTGFMSGAARETLMIEIRALRAPPCARRSSPRNAQLDRSLQHLPTVADRRDHRPVAECAWSLDGMAGASGRA